jgi:hypothetical protein
VNYYDARNTTVEVNQAEIQLVLKNSEHLNLGRPITNHLAFQTEFVPKVIL